MVNNLVRGPAVVLQDVVVLCTNSLGELLRHGLLIDYSCVSAVRAVCFQTRMSMVIGKIVNLAWFDSRPQGTHGCRI